MTAVILVIHIMISLALIGVVLIQKSEGGGLGMGGGGMGGFMTGRSQANLLTKITAILAVGVVVTSVSLTMLYARSHNITPSVLDNLAIPVAPQTPDNKNKIPDPTAPEPAAPVAK